VPPKLKQKREAFDWFELSPDERFRKRLPFSQPELAAQLGVKPELIPKWRKEWEDYKASQTVSEDSDYNSAAFLNGKSKVADEALIAACEMGKADALRTYYQITRRLIDQRIEYKVELSADELSKRNIEAERQLREQGLLQRLRVEEVPKKLPLLSENICEGEGRAGRDNPV